MGRWKHPLNVRTVIEKECVPGVVEVVEDVWPFASCTASYKLLGTTHGVTFVEKGTVYVREGDVVTRYEAGDYFLEKPGIVHVVGSVRGDTNTTSWYYPALTGNILFIPEVREVY